jgi:hypothetical protein
VERFSQVLSAKAQPLPSPAQKGGGAEGCSKAGCKGRERAEELEGGIGVCNRPYTHQAANQFTEPCPALPLQVHPLPIRLQGCLPLTIAAGFRSDGAPSWGVWLVPLSHDSLNTV